MRVRNHAGVSEGDEKEECKNYKLHYKFTFLLKVFNIFV
jgi:hypothetical protein